MRSADSVEPSVETPGGASTVVARDGTERLRTRTRWGYGGFAIGLGLGFALTAAQVASAGYAILPFQFVWNLIWAPFMGVVIGRALSRTRRIEPCVETSGGASTASARDETERLRTRTRWGYGGLAIGLGLGLALTAAQVASAGYFIIPFQFGWNLIWAPFLGVVIGRALSRTQPIEPSVETSGGASTVAREGRNGTAPYPHSLGLRRSCDRHWAGPRLHGGRSRDCRLRYSPVSFRPEHDMGPLSGTCHWACPELPPKPKQLRIRTLMLIVAYLALLLGVGVSTAGIGVAARRYLQERINSAEMVKIYREEARKCDADAKLKRKNVTELQAGRIPKGLHQIQRAVLQSLEDDAKATPDYRTYRRGLITEGEEQNRIRMENNVVVLRRIAEHFERLAAKYEWFQWHPWLPIEPDPPVPN